MEAVSTSVRGITALCSLLLQDLSCVVQGNSEPSPASSLKSRACLQPCPTNCRSSSSKLNVVGQKAIP